jgi:hypothetical protein
MNTSSLLHLLEPKRVPNCIQSPTKALTTSEAPFEWTTARSGICHPSSLAVAHLNLKLSRLNWSTDRQPISFMSRWISARRFPSALSTPA